MAMTTQLKNLTRGAMLVAAGSLLASGTLHAAELSLLSGLYQSEEDKTDGKDAGGMSTISAGGRFSDQLDARMFWFGQGMLTLRSYDAPDGGKAPSDSTSLTLGGGVRYYFTKLAESVSPFAYGLGQYKSDKSGSGGGTSYAEKEDSGLYYGASFGIRFSLDKDFFVDFETPLFESALFATTKTETTTETTAGTTTTKTTTKEEKKRTELYADTTGAFGTMVVALGMRL